MRQRFEDILAECLEAVTAGQRTIEECLALYPQWSDRLEPLLRRWLPGCGGFIAVAADVLPGRRQ